jgi:endonuclease/exonuclease/phosphatase family metal-dependent hydrolase
MRNLIREYGITSTRSSLYATSPVMYADYALTTPGVKVNEFKVLPDEVSDHLALLLDFEIE